LLQTTILWTHAVAGAIWIGACACFAIAGLALGAGSPEQRNFVAKSASKIDALGLVAAAVLLATGLTGLTVVTALHGFAFSTAFMTVLAIKIGLFVVMLVAMTWSMRVGAAVRAAIAREHTGAAAAAMPQMVKAHVAVVAMGAVALILGTWLMGS
jgi:hypothetical protein